MTTRAIALFAFACALVLRIAVPSGWMPMVVAEGTLVLAPCPAADPVKMEHPDDHHSEHKEKSDGKSANGGDCAFAPLQTGLDGWDYSAPLTALYAEETLASVHRPIAYLPRGPPALPPPATGPPPNA